MGRGSAGEVMRGEWGVREWFIVRGGGCAGGPRRCSRSHVDMFVEVGGGARQTLPSVAGDLFGVKGSLSAIMMILSYLARVEYQRSSNSMPERTRELGLRASINSPCPTGTTVCPR